ncbi:hypothetical protein BDF21DRAFT_449074 [Thamnidium elegans]|nr:hypothetical protein BDF21DRAFT_449074 [Thamnidium elegans]
MWNQFEREYLKKFLIEGLLHCLVFQKPVLCLFLTMLGSKHYLGHVSWILEKVGNLRAVSSRPLERLIGMTKDRIKAKNNLGANVENQLILSANKKQRQRNGQYRRLQLKESFYKSSYCTNQTIESVSIDANTLLEYFQRSSFNISAMSIDQLNKQRCTIHSYLRLDNPDPSGERMNGYYVGILERIFKFENRDLCQITVLGCIDYSQNTMFPCLNCNRLEYSVKMILDLSQIVCKACYLSSVKQSSSNNSVMTISILWNFTEIADGFKALKGNAIEDIRRR